MNRLKPVIARTPEKLAGALGPPAVAAKEWQVQHVLLKKLKAFGGDGRRSLMRRLRSGQAHRKPG
jgi:hypothetical protein